MPLGRETEFLSTLPARGATSICKFKARSRHFYPRSPRGERQSLDAWHYADYYISIHAPREGSDLTPHLITCGQKEFLSTLPARGATATRQPTL